MKKIYLKEKQDQNFIQKICILFIIIFVDIFINLKKSEFTVKNLNF